MVDAVVRGLRSTLSDVAAFSQVFVPQRVLRDYQALPARQIAASVIARRRGDALVPGAFAVVFSRQAGKDEMLAQLLAYLLVLFHQSGGRVVVGLPTLRPQGQIARDRLLSVVAGRPFQALGFQPERDGASVSLGQASVHFVSAGPNSNARGQTASLLLVANECQDIDPDRWDAVFAPMAASTDAVTLYMGTVWTRDTLLARQMRYLEGLERADDRRRLFTVPWRDVAAELPQYGRYVERQMALLGEAHPFIQTEYELVELDGAGGLFPPSRRGQMAGTHPPLTRATPGETYALLLDVAGEEEDATDGVTRYDPTARRDSTALTVVRVVRVAGERPRYEAVRRYLWTGVKHTALHEQIVDLTRNVWRARYVVVDATGVGAGLASFLSASLGERVVLPFTFSLATKSDLGWTFLGIVDGGRYKDYDPDAGDDEAVRLARVFWRQVAACRYEVRSGPGRLISWDVPDGRTHDDLLISAALSAVLDGQDWSERRAVGR